MTTDMTIEKLQKVATTNVDASFKARWLQWWNSSADIKLQNKFPPALPLREKVLDDWLVKASWWAQVHPSNPLSFLPSFCFPSTPFLLLIHKFSFVVGEGSRG